MKWLKLIKYRALGVRPILRTHNPRLGTSIIPLDQGDGDIFFNYLSNKVHSLQYEGLSSQLEQMIHRLRDDQGFTIQKMRLSPGKGSERVMLLHLKMADQQELRRVIKLI